MSDKGYDRIAMALHEAIGAQTRNVLAKVTGTLLLNGTIPCYSEAEGNINAICRTTDDIHVGDWIYIYKSAPEKYAAWMYAGFASSADRKSQPGISAATVITVPPLNDGGGTAPAGGSPAPAGSLQEKLDAFAKQLRQIQGTSAWDSAPATSLASLVTWHTPVDTVTALPSVGNRLGDVRVVLDTSTIYLWSASGWRSPSGGSLSSAASTALIRLSDHAVSSFTLLAITSAGGVIASATNSTHAGRLVGMTIESGGAGQDVLVQLSGEIMMDSAPAAQGPVLLGANGSLSATLVTGARFVQPVGVVLGSRLLLSIDTTIIEME